MDDSVNIPRSSPTRKARILLNPPAAAYMCNGPAVSFTYLPLPPPHLPSVAPAPAWRRLSDVVGFPDRCGVAGGWLIRSDRHQRWNTACVSTLGNLHFIFIFICQLSLSLSLPLPASPSFWCDNAPLFISRLRVDPFSERR